MLAQDFSVLEALAGRTLKIASALAFQIKYLRQLYSSSFIFMPKM